MVFRTILVMFALITVSCINRSQEMASIINANDDKQEKIAAKDANNPPLLGPSLDPGIIIPVDLTPIYPRFMGGGGPHRPLEPRCGDRHVDDNEECDDGNTDNNDGCSANCTIEEGFPLCSWQCDDPVCVKVCQPQCQPPSCEIQCAPPPNQPNCNCTTSCEDPVCEVVCPEDQCETEHCPACNTVCQPPDCRTRCRKINPSGPDCENPPPECETLCAPTICGWKCSKPTSCPKPQCELQCEQIDDDC